MGEIVIVECKPKENKAPIKRINENTFATLKTAMPGKRESINYNRGGEVSFVAFLRVIETSYSSPLYEPFV